MKREKISVIVADDSTAVRKAVLEILTRIGRGIHPVAEASNGRELLDAAERVRADIYVVDIEMPLMDGIEATRRLLELFPESRVVILSIYRDRVLVERAFKAGARGYVLKENVAEDILKAIEEVHGGGIWASPQIAGYVP